MWILTTLLISLPLICTPLTAVAGEGGNKGPGGQAWEHANDNANFKRGGDEHHYEYHDRWKQTAGDRDRDHDEDDSRDRDRDRENTGADSQGKRPIKSFLGDP